MSILTQLLIVLVICAALYAAYLHDKTPFQKIWALFPDLRAHASEHGGHHAAAPALSASVKIVVYVPDAHADAVRKAIGEAGGGTIGNYTFCSFSSLGTGRYLPGPGAHPMVGTVGVHERVEEERIEFTACREKLAHIVDTIKKVHPYEEIIIDIYPLEAQPTVHSH